MIYNEIEDKYGDVYEVVHTPDIENAPTIKAEPVISSRWKKVRTRRDSDGDLIYAYKCDKCNFGLEVYDEVDLTNFCGDCGARMEGE